MSDIPCDFVITAQEISEVNNIFLKIHHFVNSDLLEEVIFIP